MRFWMGFSLAFTVAACRPNISQTVPPPVVTAESNSSGGAAIEAAPATSASAACGNAPLLPLNASVRGSTARRRDLFHATCGFGAASGDAVYRFRLDAPTHVHLALHGAHDTVLSVRRACDDDTTELACSDDTEGATDSAIDLDLPAGEYVAIADGFGSSEGNSYELSIRARPVRTANAPTLSIARLALGEGAQLTHEAGATGAIVGTASFAKRDFTLRGLTRATHDVPIAHAVIEAVDARGAVVASGATDAQGAFSLDVPAGREVRVRVLSRTTLLGSDLRIVSDPGSERPYELSTRVFRVEGGERITFHAMVGGVEPAGAFNILAQFVRYLPHTSQAFNRPLPPLYAFWRRGNNDALPQGSITAFLNHYHRHEGAYALQIQGGEAGREDASDADQFDDPVVLHEFSHFVVHTMAGHFSIGGNHPGRALYFPALAMDEGFASALACAVARDGRYWDTNGLEPSEPAATARNVLLEEDSERMTDELRGVGSQNIAQAMLWDMIDGADGIDDHDNDGVAIGLTGALRVYASFREDPSVPAMNSFLERAVSLNLVTDAQARAFVRAPQTLGFSYPIPPGERWPEVLSVGASIRGRLDGRTNPAPSGGRNNPFNALDALRTYQLHVAQRQRVTIELAMDQQGTQETGSDLDLLLATRGLRELARSDGTTRQERIELELEPGDYLVIVRDGDSSGGASLRVGGAGNRGTFTLRVY